MRTRVTQAQDRVRTEQETVSAKVDGFEAFLDRVRDVPTASASSPRTVADGGLVHAGGSTTDHRQRVRQAFAETVHSHTDGTDSLLETIREELSETIAAALAPTTDASFSPKLKQVVLSEASARRAETAVLDRALAREVSHLETAGERVDEITDWLAAADETPLPDLAFDALCQRHETLAHHRRRCDELASARQQFLEQTTGRGTDGGIAHQSLPPALYEDFAVDHPLLATVARLDATCAECQRVVRQHVSLR